MAYCINCGVELAPGAAACPLCGWKTGTAGEAGAPAGHARGEHPHLAEKIFDPDDKEKLTEDEQRKIVWEVRSVSAAIMIVAVVSINLVVSGRLSWSLYPLFSLAFLWVLATVQLLFHARPAIIAAVSAVALPLFLVSVDFAGGRPLSWSLTMALPITLVLEAAAGITYWASLTVKRKGANLAAFILIAIVAVCVAVEATLDLALEERISFGWSFIVAFALLPVAAFLLYIHYRIGKKATLRKIFRL
jgi:hypothetical protein